MGEAAVFATGLLVGSFLNATAWRLRSRRTASMAAAAGPAWIWVGRSACPGCGHRLAPRDLVPVLSWVLLRGRCRYCSQTISVRYPVTELATAVALTVAFTAL